MKLLRSAFLPAALFALLLSNTAPLPAQSSEAAPLRVSLREAVTAAVASNTQIRVDAFLPAIREVEVVTQEAGFDPNLTFTAKYQDTSNPTNNLFDLPSIDPNAVGSFSTFKNAFLDAVTNPIAIDSSETSLNTQFIDRLHTGAFWSANLYMGRFTSTSANALYPESYFSNLQFQFTQPFLKGFGRDNNEVLITVARKNQEIDEETFRKRVQDTLLEVEAAYWVLVYERQDLEVRREALALAQELLRLNKIRVDVGTLPPIDITQAEAGVASREEAVIIAQANIENAEDRLKRVMGIDPKSSDWNRPIVPTEDLALIESSISLDAAVHSALENRTDLKQAKLRVESAEVSLDAQKNRMQYRLDGIASYSLQGLAGDTNAFPVQTIDPNGNLTTLGVVPGIDSGIDDSLDFVTGGDFPTWSVQLVLGIPVGNRPAEAAYTRDRLVKEQRAVEYQNLEQAAIVAVGTAVRKVQTDRKRIDAAEKNRILQEKTVEAEQKKFENGLSTSFEVLQLQRDLAEARSSENAARRDYRTSMATLEAATGTLEKSLGVKLEEYQHIPK
jgi:outer membrane protein TolC